MQRTSRMTSWRSTRIYESGAGNALRPASPAMTSPNNNRLQIDTLRGLACLLLVLYHVVGDSAGAGLKLPAEHGLSVFNHLVAFGRMPLFACIAGFVYALRPLQREVAQFIGSKMRRLLLPLFFVGSAFGLLRARMSGVTIDADFLLRMHLTSIDQFWFLKALFWIFLVIVALERAGALRRPEGFAGVLAASALWFVFWDSPDTFAISGAVYLLPYFLVGLAIRRFALDGRGSLAVAGCALLVAAALSWSVFGQPENRVTIAAKLLWGCGLGFLLIRSRIRSEWLAWIGRESFAVYLFHVFFTAATASALLTMGVRDVGVLLVAGLLMGVGMPMIAARIIRRSWLLDLLLLGEKAPAVQWPWRKAQLIRVESSDRGSRNP